MGKFGEDLLAGLKATGVWKAIIRKLLRAHPLQYCLSYRWQKIAVALPLEGNTLQRQKKKM